MPRRTITPTRTRGGTPTRAAALGVLLALILLLSGCIKYEGTIKIEDDGSGTVDILTAIDPSAFSAFAEFGDLGDDLGDDFATEFGQEALCADLLEDGAYPVDARVEPYNEDGFCGSRVQYALAASTDHSNALADALDESTRIYKEGDNWFFDTNFNTDEITGEAAAFGGDDLLGDAFEDASFVITVDLPGRAIEGANNATGVGDDGRFTWDIDLLNPPARLFAQTEPGSGGGTGGPSGDGGSGIGRILIGVAVLAALGAGAYFFLKNKNSGADTAQASPFDPGPMAAQSSSDLSAVLPVIDGPPIAGSPPINVAGPAGATADAMKETVVLSAADAQQYAQQAAADGAATVDPAGATPQPVYDEALGAWIVDDPARGRLRHDPATDSWNPI